MRDYIASFFLFVRQAQWLPILVVRVSVGVFFAISGGNKLFVSTYRQALIETLIESGIPFPQLNAVFVSSVELFFGVLLMVGLLTPLCAVMLGGSMVVAIMTNAIYRVHGDSLLNWLDNFLYLPEVLLLLMLSWLFFSGPGRVSIDHHFLRRMGFDADQM